MRKLKNSELNRISPGEFKKAEKLPVVVVLDNIRSLNNTGSFFRTGDAFRIEEIVLCGITATPPHREIHKTALGATESVDWRYFKNTVDAINDLKKKGYSIIAIEQTDEKIFLHEFDPSEFNKIAFIFGNEIKGVSDEVLGLLDLSIEIPQYGTKHSVNVSVSGGIVLWHTFYKLNADNIIV
jgi:tRNA G18 (ribose-2'-O)-methylase SpoU